MPIKYTDLRPGQKIRFTALDLDECLVRGQLYEVHEDTSFFVFCHHGHHYLDAHLLKDEESLHIEIVEESKI